ncbi:hypothetical protein ABIC29_000235 [Agromyces sp. PvR057]
MTEFRAVVEPHEKMRGLEVPETAVEELGGGRRPRVSVTVNGHSWETRVAIMLGRNLIGLSHANRAAAGLEVGDEVTVRLELVAEPVDADVPDDVAAARCRSGGARQVRRTDGQPAAPAGARHRPGEDGTDEGAPHREPRRRAERPRRLSALVGVGVRRRRDFGRRSSGRGRTTPLGMM